ncbi:MAG TPA: cyclophane-forming radical SAM/SPASM peptide maturase GrrM/OscB [Rubrivivax sp.]|nr:cyclophane-forming radical SAM/SPASM peptide maturase GrrM/OscB [Rubrivivax sp.]
MQTQLLVLQPTPFCNIDCSYCYLPRRDDRSRMDLDTVRVTARRLREDCLVGDELSVVWHSGEPLAVPVAWYAQAFAVLADELIGIRVQHALQTNATLIDGRWCDFFRRHQVQVGVSVDGPAFLHDLHRRTRRGGATHAATQRGMRLLREHGVPFHAIAVVTAATLGKPDVDARADADADADAQADAFYDWFVEQGISELGCNFDEAEGVNRTSSLAGLERQHRAFLARLLQRSLAGPVVVRELAAAWQLLQEPLPQWGWRGLRWPLNSQAMPLALLTVLHNGDFGSFSPELVGQPWPAYNDFVLGNVHRGGFLQALHAHPFTALWQDIRRGVQACEQHCAYFAHCGGGAPANKLYETGDFGSTETLHCRSMMQRPFDVVLQHAESSLAKRQAA